MFNIYSLTWTSVIRGRGSDQMVGRAFIPFSERGLLIVISTAGHINMKGEKHYEFRYGVMLLNE